MQVLLDLPIFSITNIERNNPMTSTGGITIYLMDDTECSSI